MDSDSVDGGDSIPPDLLEELAASGALCETCGGLHVPDIATAIMAIRGREETRIRLPWCSCDCRTCNEFRKSIRRFRAEADDPRRVWSAPEVSPDPSGTPR